MNRDLGTDASMMLTKKPFMEYRDATTMLIDVMINAFTYIIE